MKRREFIKTSAVIAAATAASGAGNLLKAAERPDEAAYETADGGAEGPESPADGRLIVSAPVLQNYAETSMGVVFAVSALANGYVLVGQQPDLSDARKVLCGGFRVTDIDDRVNLISPEILEPITNLKVGILGSNNPRLHPNEVLIALSICAVTDPIAAKAMEQLPKLRHCEMHSSVILSENDVHTLKKLGINLTCEPTYESKRLFHGC